MLKLSMLPFAVIVLTGCIGRTSKSPSVQGNSSHTTSIAVGVPDKRPLAATAPQIETLMNGFMIVADPLTPGCQPGAQRIEEYGDYSSATSQASLLQGCDYNLTIAFGNKDPGVNSLKAVYLKNNSPYLIRKEETAGQPTLNKQIAVQVQPEGAALGLRPPQNSGSVPPSTIPGTPPGTQSGTVNFSPGKDLQVTGNSGATTLSKAFKGELMIVDISGVGCAYCIERAKELDANPTLQQALNGTKCSRITLIDDLAGWAGLGFGTSSFVGQNTYQISTSATAAGRALGAEINGTPYYIVLDRNGNIVPSSEKNSEPMDVINSRCK